MKKKVKDISFKFFRNRRKNFPTDRSGHPSIKIKYLHLYHPLNFMAALLLTCLILSSSDRRIFVLFLSLVCFLIFRYFATRKIASAIEVKRLLKKKEFVERESINLQWEISNPTALELSDIQILDSFGPSQKQKINIFHHLPIKSSSQAIVEEKVYCDGGMGLREIGPLKAIVKDSLGIFSFLIEFGKVEQVEVYPNIEPIPEFPELRLRESYSYGGYSSHMAGHDVNFTGVRPFQSGDSLRYISWKVTTRQNELMVKEFEKNVNFAGGIVLNLDPAMHIGRRRLSTWEKQRDVALSLAAQHIDQGHQVSVLTNSFSIEPSSGENHFHSICLKVSRFSDFDEPPTENSAPYRMMNTEELIERAMAIMTYEQGVHLVTGLDKRCEELYLKFLRHFVDRGIYTEIVLFNTQTLFADLPEDVKDSFVPAGIRYSPDEIEAFLDKIRFTGANVIILGAQQTVTEAYLHPPFSRAQ